MPFHIHGSWMNGFPLPSSSHLSLLPSSPFFSPIFTLFRPASLNYCHGQATTSGEALCEGGREGRRCGYGCDERRRQFVTYQQMVYVYRCVLVCGKRLPMGISHEHTAGTETATHTPTHHDCCSRCDNDCVTFVMDKHIPVQMEL